MGSHFYFYYRASIWKIPFTATPAFNKVKPSLSPQQHLVIPSIADPNKTTFFNLSIIFHELLLTNGFKSFLAYNTWPFRKDELDFADLLFIQRQEPRVKLYFVLLGFYLELCLVFVQEKAQHFQEYLVLVTLPCLK